MNIAVCQATTFAILLLLAGAADAYGSLRCKGRLVDVGDSADAVLALCGEPAKRIVTHIPVRAGLVSGFTRIQDVTVAERWIYDRGWGKFPAVLHVDEGVIRRIDHLSRRSGDFQITRD